MTGRIEHPTPAAPPAPRALAWQPITFGGAARFGGSPWRRLLAAQLAAGLLVAAAMAFAFGAAWAPELRQALNNLPETGAIRDGRLEWPHAPRDLVAGKFLAVRVDPNGTLPLGHASDFSVEFRQSSVKVNSIFGYLLAPYPSGLNAPLNRAQLAPWFGAWKPALLGGLIAAILALALLCWWTIGWVISWPARALGWAARRQTDWKAAWKTAMAGLLPGALLMSLALVLYARQQISLAGLAAMAALHLVLGVLYALITPFFWPRRRPANPFAALAE